MGCAGYGWLLKPQTRKIISPLLSAGDALQLEFSAHVCSDHSSPKNPHEDANPPALRIVREATERQWYLWQRPR